MKWASFEGMELSERVLYWALTGLLRPTSCFPLDRQLEKVLSGDRAFGGDPGWEMVYEEGDDGKDYYRVFADYDYAGLEPEEVNYSVEKVREAIKESLLALAVEFPERAEEAKDVIRRYQL